MRSSPVHVSLALVVLLPALVAPRASGDSEVAVNFRAASRGTDVLLRDEATSQARANFPLPPGGKELDLQATSATPYDRYFGSVRAVIANLDAQQYTTMLEACHLMKVGYSFKYVTRDPYRPDPPKLAEAKRAGDCKSKSLWLYDNLGDAGALFTIGKAEKNSETSHAWVYWRSGGRWWILDCTERIDPIAADSVSPDRYIPYYSFGKFGTYRHPTTHLAPIAGGAGKVVSAAPSERKQVR